MANINLIDDYLANRMNEADRLAFEQKLEQDNDLRQEFNFHKGVVNSIKEARVTELKSMLNEIPVSSAAPSSIGTGAKIAAGIATTAIVIAGFVYFLNSEEATVTVSDNNVTEQEEVYEENTTPVEEKQPSTVKESEEAIPKQPEKQQSEVKQQPEVSKPAEISTPNVLDFETDEADTDITEPKAQTEAGDYSIKELFNSSIEVIIDNSRKKYNFHYQFKNEKLYLYGDFNKDLYQILEFNSQQGRTIILYFDNAYYMLDEDQFEVTPLSIIEDQELVNKLNHLRK